MTNKDIINKIEKKYRECGRESIDLPSIRIRSRISDPETTDDVEIVNELCMDSGELGIGNGKWFFPLTCLTNRELESLYVFVKKVLYKERGDN